MTRHQNSTPAAAARPREPSFQIDGMVTEVLRGCGVATVHTGGSEEFTVSRGTSGVHFEDLRVGQKISCEVAFPTQRVLHAHQETQPVHLPARTGLTKEEFIAEYCRQWGVAWSDLSRYRVVVPAGNGAGWAMANVDTHDADRTSHGSLESIFD